MRARYGNRVVELREGDITEQKVDAVVNAANSALQLGAGVAGAIRRRGGPRIQIECDAIGHTPVGRAAVTGGGELPARHVIHAVGPRMGEGDEERKLASAVRAALVLASEHRLESVALPAISTGVFGFPMDRCATISVVEALEHSTNEELPREIRFVLFDRAAYEAFAEALRRAIAPREGWRLLD